MFLATEAAHAADSCAAPSCTTISGTVFSAAGANVGLGGWTVYADVDGDGTLDADEPSAVSGSDGRYVVTVSGAASEPFPLRELGQSGWSCTAPINCLYIEPAITGSEAREGRDFGNYLAPQTAADAMRSTGTARLRVPSRCHARRAKLSVSGSGIANVSFFIDSHKLITVIHKDSRGRFSRTVDFSRLQAGVHRVRAQVTFTAASATASRTLAAGVTRCATRATSKFKR